MDGKEMTKMKIEEKMKEAKSKGKELMSKGWEALNKGLDWAIKNPDKFTLLLGGVTIGKKWLSSKKEDNHEKGTVFWDGQSRWELKRPMSMSEQLRFRRRLSNGEEAYEILDDMNLLKRW